MDFEGAELNIYLKDGREVSLSLSQAQAYVALKILGFKLEHNGQCSFYSDETLDRFKEYNGNPLRLVEV